ncbi:Uracil DNA glycosylase superfamily protein [Streptococcus oralis]|nr:Uracil DNA glycosylase superfamily protein [Streptococcus oralis]
MSQIERIKQAIMADPQNISYTERGIEPLFAAPKTARINIVGQAPGFKTQEAGIYWKDKSGDRLREWLGVDEDTFYNSGLFAVIPMDFYFPGHGKSGDLPPP